ncbi:TPA: DNA repair protein Rad50 [Campylobacter lari]|uniref:DNA repair protein Rad50 n=1 Tax=Campylobacter TaxID=194 RepID=UPI00127994EF|nr:MULTISPECIES: DNA repair protein Rad50 [Campylobacter]MCR8707462.1 DNA repair protein Rad50 [Campylobacter sp. W0066.2]MBT0832094.1 DNA repair protein Rad50 [Campylobacter lari]MCR6566479.1 DNA repair protein Rad50 [Campylobacter lari]MCV3413153.1 DNA repair protein Rad50 [Campylobacter lari]MCV3428504.1 DNA repair protein Rad50 [Campylobacter sp. IFREMER_LSEM_CL1904]
MSDISILDFLLKKYNDIKCKKNDSCIKLHYQYHNVRVNLYFNGYDKNYPSSFMILSNEKSYYITTFNVDHFDEKNQYLKEIPDPMLNLIKDNNGKLISFYNEMRIQIKKGNFENINCGYGKIFTDIIKVNKNKETVKPFFHYLRIGQMSSKHFKKLSYSTNLSKEILMKIQRAGFTIVTTSNFLEAKDFSAELKRCNIK